MSYYPKTVASKMITGLTNESDQITEIGRVLTDLGKSRTERIWLLSYDEDFIPDVLSCYNHCEFGTYQNHSVEVLEKSEYWNEALIRYVDPVGKQQSNEFKIGLPRLTCPTN